MAESKYYRENRIRFLLFLTAAAIHLVLLIFVVFPPSPPAPEEEPRAGVMKLVDVEEEKPLPPPPPPERPPEVFTNTIEAVADTMIETDEVPDYIITDYVPVQEEVIEFLPMNRVSVLPVLPEDQIRRAMVYPPIALRSGIEGIVYLELFVDPHGNIRNVTILRENPEGRGFGEAALNSLKGIQAKPAEANGQAVGIRYRYPIRFTLR